MEKINQIVVIREDLMRTNPQSHRIVFINIKKNTNIATISYGTQSDCTICPVMGAYTDCSNCNYYLKKDNEAGDHKECLRQNVEASASRILAQLKHPKYEGALSYYRIPEDKFEIFKIFYSNKLKGLNFEFDLEFKNCELDHLV